MAEAVYQIVFYLFTIALLGSAAMVVFMRNPVRCDIIFSAGVFLQRRTVDVAAGRIFILGINFCLCRRGHDLIFVCGHDAEYRFSSLQRRFCPLFTFGFVGFGWLWWALCCLY